MAARPSKYSRIFDVPQEPEETIDETATQAMVPIPQPGTTSTTVASAPEPTAPAETPTPESAARTKTGKKSDPDYKQVTAYVRKDLHEKVADALYDEFRGREDRKRKEFSQLVDQLLERWLLDRSGHNTNGDQ